MSFIDIFSPSGHSNRVVIVGGGFGGTELALRINKIQYEVVLLDRHNYLTFQPLLYQVATGGLEPDSVAYPLRKIFGKKKKVLFRLANVQSVDAAKKVVRTDIGDICYDKLVLATGSVSNFFGQETTRQHALSLKSVTDALDIRSFILQNFEKALLERDPVIRESYLNLVVVGAGPTGVEIVGALSELRAHVLPSDYPDLDLSHMRIMLVEADSKVLGAMSATSSENAIRQLRELQVDIRLGVRLMEYNGEKAVFSTGETIQTRSLFWTAGVMGNMVPGFPASSLVRGNRLLVDACNRVAGYDDVYALGDIASMESPAGPHPMLAPVAIQQARNLADNFGKAPDADWTHFNYRDKGTMATIGRSRAVADIKKLHLKGFIAWIAWLFIHLILLVGFRNKLVVMLNWIWNYFSYDRAIRLIIRPYKNIH